MTIEPRLNPTILDCLQRPHRPYMMQVRSGCWLARRCRQYFPVPGIYRHDSAAGPLQEKTAEFQPKKMHLDATSSALAALHDGLPGIHHHIHDQAYRRAHQQCHRCFVCSAPAPVDFTCRSCEGVSLKLICDSLRISWLLQPCCSKTHQKWQMKS